VTPFPTKLGIGTVMAFKKKVQASLFPLQRDPREEKFYLVLNRTLQAFLYPPGRIFLSAIAIDFRRSQEVTIPSVVRQLFDSTTRYFSLPRDDAWPSNVVDVSRQKHGANHGHFQEALLLPSSEEFQLQCFLVFVVRKSRVACCSGEDA